MNSISRDSAAEASKQTGDCTDVDSSTKSVSSDAQQQAIRAAKQALRTRLLPLRSAALERGPDVNAAIAKGVRAWLDTQNCRCVAFYWPLTGEPDLRATIIAWLARDSRRRAALPLVVRAAAPLRFVAWDADTPMRIGQYGIAVPDVTLAPLGEEIIPDALLIPCVGFDARGYRLGYGGGFYDRTLARLRETTAPPHFGVHGAGNALNAGSVLAQRPATLGIALNDTGVAALPIDAFDLPLDGIQTESRLYVVK